MEAAPMQTKVYENNVESVLLMLQAQPPDERRRNVLSLQQALYDCAAGNELAAQESDEGETTPAVTSSARRRGRPPKGE
jgi:hypothetical protein